MMGGLTTEIVLLVLRGGLLLAFAFGITLAMRGAPASLRHHVWTLTFLGLLALPILSVVGPNWSVAAPFEVPGIVAEGSRGADVAMTTRDPAGAMLSPDDASRAAPIAGSPSANQSAGGTESVAASPSLADRLASLPAASWPFIVWALGTAFFLGRLLVGTWHARRIVRRAVAVTDRDWTSLVALLSLRSGLTDDVRVVRSAEVSVPMAWGLFGSWLVLPADSADWSEERRRVVVLHELAHLRRRDCLKQFLAQLALATHWVNPLAWRAMARMHAERERASDDAVLMAGTPGSAYAGHLVEVARGLTGSTAPLRAAVAMARRSELEGRVLAILDDRRPRVPPARRLYVAAAAGIIALVLPLAAFTPASPEMDRPADPAASHASAAAEPGAADRDDHDEQARAEKPTDKDAGQRAKEQATPPVIADVAVAADTIEEKVVRVLAEKLATGDVSMRRRAAQTLGSMEHPAAVPALMAAVTSDEDASVRAKSAWALGMIERSEAVDALASAVRDEDRNVREKALWALGMIESPRGVPAVVSSLDDADGEIRETAAWALGMIESSEAVAPLLEALRTEQSAEIREKIVWALGMIESSEAVGSLMEAFEDEPDAEVREQIIWALGMIESREAAPTILDALEDPNEDVQDQALWALGMVLN